MRVRVYQQDKLSIYPLGGKKYIKGSMIISDVLFLTCITEGDIYTWIVGDVLAETDNELSLPPTVEEIALQIDEGFKTPLGEDVTDYRFDFAYLCGRKLYVWDE